MKTTHTFTILFLSALFLPWSAQAQKPSDSPDFFFRLIGQSLKRNRPDVVLKALPPSYVKDMQGVVRAFAANIDADLFNQGAGMIKDLTRVMDSKKDIIMKSEMMKGMSAQAGAANTDKSWDENMAVMKALAGSDFLNLEALKKADLPTLLYKDGSKIMSTMKAIDPAENPGVLMMNDSLDMIANSTFKVSDQEGDSATVTIFDGDDEMDKVPVKRVEGRWIPADMADGWADGITEAKAGLMEMKAGMAEAKPMVMGVMTMAKGMIGQVEAAKTPGDIDKAFGGIMEMAGGMMGGLMGNGAPPGGGDDEEQLKEAFELEFKEIEGDGFDFE